MESATGEGKKVRKKKRETSRDERRGVGEKKSGCSGKERARNDIDKGRDKRREVSVKPSIKQVLTDCKTSHFSGMSNKSLGASFQVTLR